MTHNSLKYLLKSPFIIATIAGSLVVAADGAWLVGELMTHFEVISINTYVIYRMVILSLILIGFIGCLIAVKQYILNGYIRQEHKDELSHKKEELQQNKRNKIFKR